MSLHFLIVDADTSAARITEAVVKRVAPDATVTVAPDANRDALGDQGQYPDALIIDLSQHNLAGARLIQELKRIYPAAQVIVLASAPTLTLRRMVQQLGVDMYLAKPAPLAQLTEVLRVTLRQIEQQRVSQMVASIRHGLQVSKRPDVE